MRHTAILIAVLLAFTAHGAFAATFTARVTNMTTSKPLAGYPVSVRVVNPNRDGTNATVREAILRTGKDGVFSGEIETGGAKSIIAEVSYRGVTYSSKAAGLSDSKGHFVLDVPVYEITDSNSLVSIPAREIIVMVTDERTLQVFETLTVQNTGDRTFIGRFNDDLETNQVLNIPMPRNYMVSGYNGPTAPPRIRAMGRGVVTMGEILPGTHTIRMSYYVKSDIGLFDFTLFAEKDAPPVKILTVAFPDIEQWRIKSSSLKPADTRDFGGKPYKVLKGEAGSVAHISVYGPTYAGGFGIWEAAMFIAFGVTGISLFLARGFIKDWLLRREAVRLEALSASLREQADEQDLEGYYRPFLDTIEGRLGVIEDAREDDA